MKINMSVWITENSNFLSYDDVIANERYTNKGIVTILVV